MTQEKRTDLVLVPAWDGEAVTAAGLLLYFRGLMADTPQAKATRKQLIGEKGLCFGGVRIGDSNGSGSVEFETGAFTSSTVTLDALEVILREYAQQLCPQMQFNYRISRDFKTIDMTELRKAKGGGSDRYCFLEIKQEPFCRVTVFLSTSAAMSIFFALCKRFNVALEQVYFARESLWPLDIVVSYAMSWIDTATGKHYLEILFDKTKDRGQSRTGRWVREVHFTDIGDFKLVVFGSIGPMEFKINNQIVEPTVIDAPTENIIAARNKLRKDEACHCAAKGWFGACKNLVAHEVYFAKSGATGIGGGFSRGTTLYSCKGHVKKVKKMDTGYEVTVSDFTPQVW